MLLTIKIISATVTIFTLPEKEKHIANTIQKPIPY